MRCNKLVERGDPQPAGTQAATRACCIVSLAALLGAVGEDRLERRAIEVRHPEGRQCGIDGALMAGLHDRGDGPVRPAHEGLTIANVNYGHCTFKLCRYSRAAAAGTAATHGLCLCRWIPAQRFAWRE
jgi:hypothetical protein